MGVVECFLVQLLKAVLKRHQSREDPFDAKKDLSRSLILSDSSPFL